MYQSIYYNRTTKQYHVRDDKKGWVTFPYRATCYVPNVNGEYKTLDGVTVSPTLQYGYKDPNVYESDVDKYTRVLVDAYYDSDETPTYQNIVYLDIECEIVSTLNQDNVRNPQGKITAIALYDNNTKNYHCYVLDETQDLKTYRVDNKNIISCVSEKNLLSEFLNKWEELDPTIISGWNSEFFDIPYLYHRIAKVLGTEEAVRLSPLKRVDDNDFLGVKTTTIAGLNHLDYMLLFKKYVTTQEPSYALGNIGTKYVNLGKLEYLGSLDKLFKEDVNKFIDYNIRDVEIIVALEDKLKFIDLTVTVCHLCHTPYDQIYMSTVLNDGATLTYLKRNNIVSPNKPTTYNPSLKDISIKKAELEYKMGKISKLEFEEMKILAGYAGGYLKDPEPGLYEWVIDLDFTSLYPSIIRSLNIGIETLVGRIVNRDKYDNQWSLKELKTLNPSTEISIERVNPDRTVSHSKTTVEKIIRLIEQNNWIISAPGVIFRKDIPSVICDILTDWFNKRVEYKGLMKKAFKVDKDPIKGDFYNRRQHAYKIKLNDVYGCYAINSWRYTDGHKFISKAITLTGQRLTQESIKHVNIWMNNEMKTEGIDYIVTSDTDSLFIQVKDLLRIRYPELDMSNREETVKYVLEIATEIQKIANDNLNTLVVDLFNLHDREHYFELKQEVVLERGYFAGKRRYAQFIVNKEGVSVEELDIKGLDLMKSNFPPYFRDFTKNIIQDIMFGKSKPEIDKQILTFRESIDTVDWKLLLKPTGLKNMGDYIASPPKAGEIFSRLGLKCPINTKAAIYYNDILRFKQLDKQYNTFQVGDKMFIAYLKDNPYRIDVIGFNGYNDPPFIVEFIEKYLDKTQLFDSVLRNKLENLYADLKWGKPIFNSNINKFFRFG
jgi:DNA polymerase elongation subunit (family B)